MVIGNSSVPAGGFLDFFFEKLAPAQFKEKLNICDSSCILSYEIFAATKTKFFNQKTEMRELSTFT